MSSIVPFFLEKGGEANHKPGKYFTPFRTPCNQRQHCLPAPGICSCFPASCMMTEIARHVRRLGSSSRIDYLVQEWSCAFCSVVNVSTGECCDDVSATVLLVVAVTLVLVPVDVAGLVVLIVHLVMYRNIVLCSAET